MRPELKIKLMAFVNERGWGKDHTGANLSRALIIEVAELNELFQWGNRPTTEKDFVNLSEELADVAIYLEYLLDLYNIDIDKAVESKINKNALKYPINPNQT